MRPTTRDRDERGAIAIEFLLTITMLMIVFLLMLQYAVRAHAQRIATAAAAEALATAAAYDGTTSSGRDSADDVLTQVAPGLDHAHVTVTRSATTVTVTVTGQVTQLIPFLPVEVSVRVEGPVERFVPPSGEFTNSEGISGGN